VYGSIPRLPIRGMETQRFYSPISLAHCNFHARLHKPTYEP